MAGADAADPVQELHTQDSLRMWVFHKLHDANVASYEMLLEAAVRMMEVAKAIHGRLPR